MTKISTNPVKRVPFSFFLVLLTLVLVLLCLVALTLGPARVGVAEVLQALTGRLPLLDRIFFGEIDLLNQKILFGLRLPRIILAVLVGAALAVAGVIFQGLFRNPMADPYVLGASSGAAFGATMAAVSGSNLLVFGLGARPLFAFAGALLTTTLVYRLARSGRRYSLTTLLLAGIAVSAFMSALTTLLLFFRQEELGRVLFWTMGGFSYTRWVEVKVILPYLVFGLLLASRFARELNLLLLGEEKAHQLGLEVEKLQRYLLFTASLLVAAAVSVAGTIGFVGLVVPHIMRLLLGPDHRPLLPLSALAGGIFLLVADTLARMLLAPGELPVGILTSFVGGPFFLYLLRKNRQIMH
ncbi:MAG: iron chelate uptake ABC transporter family permease subunit [Firmicutes bacterium]|nr:iron chelate uptake ABC transporter family permease subunit [Bacillota bacterium]